MPPCARLTAAPTARPATGRAAALAQLEAGEAAIGAGALDAGLQCLRRAIVEADATGDAALRARARVALGGALVHAARGRDEEGATALHEALEVGREVSPVLAAAACRELGYVEFLRGRYERTLAWLQRAGPLAGGRPRRTGAHRHRATAPRSATPRTTRPPSPCCAKPKRWRLPPATTGSSPMRCPCWAARCCCTMSWTPPPTPWTASVALAQPGWTAFVPWPQSLRAEVDLLRGDVERRREPLRARLRAGLPDRRPLLGRHCRPRRWGAWRWRAASRGAPSRFCIDALARCVRLPDAYLWGKGYALDALCGVAVAGAMPQASAWINELQDLAARSGMRELTVRAYLHRVRRSGDSASAAAARLLAGQIDNPALHALAGL